MGTHLNENLLCPFAVCASACNIVHKLAEHVKWLGWGVRSAHVLRTKSDEVVDQEEGGEAVRRANVLRVRERGESKAERKGPESTHEGEGGEGVNNCVQRRGGRGKAGPMQQEGEEKSVRGSDAYRECPRGKGVSEGATHRARGRGSGRRQGEEGDRGSRLQSGHMRVESEEQGKRGRVTRVRCRFELSDSMGGRRDPRAEV